jgi:endonuclease G
MSAKSLFTEIGKSLEKNGATQLASVVAKRASTLDVKAAASGAIDGLLDGLSDDDAAKVRSFLPIGQTLHRPSKSLPSGPALQPGQDRVVKLDQLAPIEQARFEATVGQADFLPAHFLVAGAERQKSVCRIRAKASITAGDGSVVAPGSGWGTGFLISPTLLMTNNHVIPTAEFAKSNIVAQFNFQVNELGELLPIDEFEFAPDNGFYTQPDLDVTVVRLMPKANASGQPATPGMRWGTLRMDSNIQFAEQQVVNIVQHPQGRFKEVVLTGNQIVRIENKIIRYLADTEQGSSGSPVFDNTWKLVALHHRAGDIGQDGVLNNEGVRMDRILEDLRANAAKLAAEL